MLEPSDELSFERGQVRDAMAQEGGTNHCDVCASHQKLDDVGRIMDTTCRCEVSLNFPVENRYPARRGKRVKVGIVSTTLGTISSRSGSMSGW